MRYLLLVSHGTFAPGLHSVLDMLVGKREDILSCSLRDGEGADEYVAELEKVVEKIGADDEVIVMGDIIGGSPLTNALNVLAGRGLLPGPVRAGALRGPGRHARGRARSRRGRGRGSLGTFTGATRASNGTQTGQGEGHGSFVRSH